MSKIKKKKCWTLFLTKILTAILITILPSFFSVHMINDNTCQPVITSSQKLESNGFSGISRKKIVRCVGLSMNPALYEATVDSFDENPMVWTKYTPSSADSITRYTIISNTKQKWRWTHLFFGYILHWLFLCALCAQYKPIIKNNYTAVCSQQSVTTGCSVLLHKSITVVRIRSLHSHKDDSQIKNGCNREKDAKKNKQHKTWQPIMSQCADDAERVTELTTERASHCWGKCWKDCLWSKLVCSLTSCSTLTQCLQVLTDDGSSLVGRLIDPTGIPDSDVALLNGAVQEMHLATLLLEHHHLRAAKVKEYKEPFDFYGLGSSLPTIDWTEKIPKRQSKLMFQASRHC